MLEQVEDGADLHLGEATPRAWGPRLQLGDGMPASSRSVNRLADPPAYSTPNEYG